jgi:lysophospholipase L1-like esterase
MDRSVASRSSPLTPRNILTVVILAALVFGGVLVWRGRAGLAGAGVSYGYVALGASDAVGVGATRPTTEGWVPVVADGLPAGTHALNLGVSGATLGDMLADQLPVALDAAPRWVTVWPAPNDFRNGTSLAMFADQLEQLLAALLPADVNQQRTIAVLTLPDLRSLPSFARSESAALDARVREWNAVIAEVVGRHAPRAVLVDLYGSWAELESHPEYISGDGFHPSSAGYRRIAELTLDTLRRHDPALAR